MANCTDYNCDDVFGTYNEAECGEELVGGMDAAVLLACDHQLTDPSSQSQIAAEIAAGRAVLVTGASFSIEPASPVTQDSIVPCRPASVSTYNRTGVYKNPNITSENITFHQGIFKGKKLGGIILHECGTEDAINGPQVTWIDAVVTFTGSRIVPGTTTEKQRFEGTFSWISQIDSQIYDAPASIFG